MSFLTFSLLTGTILGWAVAGVCAVQWAKKATTARWTLEGWNRACVVCDHLRDSIERQADTIHDLRNELAAKGETP